MSVTPAHAVGQHWRVIRSKCRVALEHSRFLRLVKSVVTGSKVLGVIGNRLSIEEFKAGARRGARSSRAVRAYLRSTGAVRTASAQSRLVNLFPERESGNLSVPDDRSRETAPERGPLFFNTVVINADSSVVAHAAHRLFAGALALSVGSSSAVLYSVSDCREYAFKNPIPAVSLVVLVATVVNLSITGVGTLTRTGILARGVLITVCFGGLWISEPAVERSHVLSLAVRVLDPPDRRE